MTTDNAEAGPYKGPEIGPDTDPEKLWEDLGELLVEPGVVSADQPTHPDEQLDTPMPSGDAELVSPYDEPEVNVYPEEATA